MSITVNNAKSRITNLLMNSNGDGGLVSAISAVSMLKDMPTLVIGLGGTGMDALLRIKYEVSRRLICQEGQDKPEGIAYLGMDTDVAKLGANVQGMGLNPQTEFVSLAVDGLRYLLEDKNRIFESYRKDWMDPRLEGTGAAEGANGKRQIGRFMLITNAEEVIAKIAAKLSEIYDQCDNSIPINVLICSGISGGTGAGTFLDVAYIVNELLCRMSSGTDHCVSGYLFLPDVNLSKKELPDAVRSYVQPNGYAALKELDYWMSVADNGDAFSQQYTKDFWIEKAAKKPPMQICYLISAENTRGIKGDGAYDYAMRVVAESAITFISNEERRKNDDASKEAQVSAFRSYLNNLGAMKLASEPRYNANMCYAIIGADARVLQRDDIINYLAYILLDRVDGLMGNYPQKSAVEKLMSEAGINAQLIDNRLNSYAKPMSFEQFQQGHTQQDMFNGNRADRNAAMVVEAERENLKSNVEKISEDIMGKLRAKIDEAFKDADGGRGPFYAHKLLHCMDEVKGVMEYLDEAIAMTSSRIAKADAERSNEAALNRAWDTAYLKRNGLFKEGSYREYMKLAYEKYDMDHQHAILAARLEVLQQVQSQASYYNGNVVDTFVKMLKALKETFAANVSIMTNVAARTDDEGDMVYEWKILDFKDVKPDIDKALREMDDAHKRLADDFLQDILCHAVAFTGNEQQMRELGKVLGEYIENSFQQELGQSMEEQLAKKYGVHYEADPTAANSSFKSFVINRLMADMTKIAEPMFALHQGFSLKQDALEYVYASIPAAAGNLSAAVDQYVRQQGLKMTLKASENTDRMFWLQTYHKIPLYAYSKLVEYEQQYNLQANDMGRLGRHLVMNGGRDWSNLPNPIPNTAWKMLQYNNAAEAARCDAARACFYEAYHSGLVKLINRNAYFRHASSEEIAAMGLEAWEIDPAWLVDAQSRRDHGVYMLMQESFQGKKELEEQISEWLTRTPVLEGLLSRELTVYRTERKKGEEKEQVPAFADTMLFGTIQLVENVQYCFVGNEHYDTISLLNLVREPGKYRLSALFEKYIALTDAKRACLESANDEMRKNFDDPLANPAAFSAAKQACAKRLRALQEEVKAALVDMNTDLCFDAKKYGQAKLFYRALQQALEERAAIYS